MAVILSWRFRVGKFQEIQHDQSQEGEDKF